VSEPVVREWMERHLGPAGRIENAAQGAAGFLAGVPSLLARGATLVEQLDGITRDGLVLAPETVAAIGRAEAKRSRWTALALWIIAAVLLVLLIQVLWD
jgi:ubiquinone biosynthesis protein